MKSLMSRVGDKNRQGGPELSGTDKEASEIKQQNSDLRELVVRTGKRFNEDSNTEEITNTKDLEHLKKRVDTETPNKRKINLSMASKQN